MNARNGYNNGYNNRYQTKIDDNGNGSSISDFEDRIDR